MYKGVIRDVLTESDIQLYREVDLSSLFPFDKAQDRLEQRGGGAEAHGSPRAEELTLAPLRFLTLAQREEQEEWPRPPGDSPPHLSTLAPLLLLAAAQERAGEILAQAHHQAEVLQQEAYEQGMARGREQGREEAKRELLPSLFAFAQAGQSLIGLEEQLVSRLTPEIVCLALEIAEKVVGKQVEEDPQVVALVLERARAEIPQARCVRIWLHPADYHTLVELRPDLVRVGEEGGRKVEVLTSEEISRGGCRVETEMGVVDATIPIQVEEIKRQMLDEE